MNPLHLVTRTRFAPILALAVLFAPNLKAQTGIAGTSSFESAMVREFTKSEVRAEIGWTATQERTLVERVQHNRTIKADFEARVAELRQSHRADEAMKIAVEEKGYDLSMIEGEETVLLSPLQIARLKRIVLLKGGANLWNDSEVAGRLALSVGQRHDALCAVKPALSPDQESKLKRLVQYPSAWLESYSYRTVGRISVRAERSEAILEDGGRRMHAITYWQQDGTVVHMVRVSPADAQGTPEFEVTVEPAGNPARSA